MLNKFNEPNNRKADLIKVKYIFIKLISSLLFYPLFAHQSFLLRKYPHGKSVIQQLINQSINLIILYKEAMQ